MRNLAGSRNKHKSVISEVARGSLTKHLLLVKKSQNTTEPAPNDNEFWSTYVDPDWKIHLLFQIVFVHKARSNRPNFICYTYLCIPYKFILNLATKIRAPWNCHYSKMIWIWDRVLCISDSIEEVKQITHTYKMQNFLE